MSIMGRAFRTHRSMPFLPGAGFRRAVTAPLRRLAWGLLNRWIRWRFPDVAMISCEELAALLAGVGPAPVLIDARGAEEFAVSHLAGARRLSTVGAIAAGGLEPGRSIVIYCSVGYRSALLVRLLRQAGVRDVRNLEGSLFHWANLGLPLECAGPTQRQVHPFHPCWGLLLEPPNPPVGPSPGDW
jgi:rhodanese-related sulfurtransferase